MTGEAGASPALSRNCNSARRSQVACPSLSFRSLRAKGNGMGIRLGPPLDKFCFSLTVWCSGTWSYSRGVFCSLPACPFSEPLTRQREEGKGMRMAS